MLEVRQALLEEGDQAGLGRGVELLLEASREVLRLHPSVNKALGKEERCNN